jgi:hypothetical protein
MFPAPFGNGLTIMTDTMLKKFDEFGRRHPALTVLYTVFLGLIALLALMSQLQGTTILYEDF